MRMSILIVLSFGFILGQFAVADDQQPSGFTASLFDGETLNGWQVTGCEAAVEDGVILLKAGNGLVRSDHRYSDFVLDLDGAFQGADGAGELDKSAVADQLDRTAGIVFDGGINDPFAQLLEVGKGGFFVGLHQTAIANDIHGNNRCQFAFH